MIAAVAIVAGAADALAAALAERLAARGRHILAFNGDAASRARLCIRGDRLTVNGDPVDAVAFLASPDTLASGCLVDADERFATAEARALWLAALHLPTVATVNRYDADAWFRGAGWPVWRPRLRAAGVPLSPLSVGTTAGDGCSWLPWGSPRIRPALTHEAAGVIAAAYMSAPVPSPCLLVRGQMLPADAPAPPLGLNAALAAEGIELAEAWLDADGRVCVVDASPAPSLPEVVAAAADALTELLA